MISSLVGVASRTTMDLDAAITGFVLTHKSAEKVFKEIAVVNLDGDWEFELDCTEKIKESDDYSLLFGERSIPRRGIHRWSSCQT